MIKSGQDILNIGVLGLEELSIDMLYKYRDVLRAKDDWTTGDSQGMEILHRVINEKKRKNGVKRTQTEPVLDICPKCREILISILELKNETTRLPNNGNETSFKGRS